MCGPQGLDPQADRYYRNDDGVLVEDGCFFLECELDRVVDGFGINSLVIGRVVAAQADRDALRSLDPDDVLQVSYLETFLRIGTLRDRTPSGLRAWMRHQGLASAGLLGHSLGGKVAMQLALAQPALVDALVVADIAPVAYPPHHDNVFAGLDAVAAGQCPSRQAAAELMASHIEEADVIQFLLMSLRREEDGFYRWRFNLDGIKRGYAALREAPLSAAPYRGPVQFIKGGESIYIREAHRSHTLALFPRATVKVMPACGHWLHAQQPTLFNGIAGRFLDSHLS